MNRIVREHYPVAKLPEDLRAGLDLAADARVVVESLNGEVGSPRRSDTENAEAELPITRILEEMQDHRVFEGNPVDRVRALRAEWDWREEFHDRIRAGDLD